MFLPNIPKNHENQHILLIPDPYVTTHNFSLTDQLAEQTPLANRIPKAMWRGNQTRGEYNIDTYKSIPRSRLVWLSLEYPEELDARFVDYKCQSGDNPKAIEYQELMQKTFGPPSMDHPLSPIWSWRLL